MQTDSATTLNMITFLGTPDFHGSQDLVGVETCVSQQPINVSLAKNNRLACQTLSVQAVFWSLQTLCPYSNDVINTLADFKKHLPDYRGHLYVTCRSLVNIDHQDTPPVPCRMLHKPPVTDLCTCTSKAPQSLESSSSGHWDGPSPA